MRTFPSFLQTKKGNSGMGEEYLPRRETPLSQGKGERTTILDNQIGRKRVVVTDCIR